MSHNIFDRLKEVAKLTESLGDLSTLGARVAMEVIDKSEVSDEEKAKLRQINYNDLVNKNLTLDQIQTHIKNKMQ